MAKFQSTLSMRRATRISRGLRTLCRISIHALHEESDAYSLLTVWDGKSFQSTLSMRRATFLLDNRSVYGLFQSTLSMRRATYTPVYGDVAF